MPWSGKYKPYVNNNHSYHRGKKLDYTLFMDTLNKFARGEIRTMGECVKIMGVSRPTLTQRFEAIINHNPETPWEDWFSDIPEEVLKRIRASKNGN